MKHIVLLTTLLVACASDVGSELSSPSHLEAAALNGAAVYSPVSFKATSDTDLLNGEGMAAIDVNADGMTDLVHVTTNPGAVVTWLANGDGTYRTVWYTSTTDRCLIDCGTWQFADVNGDKKADLVHITTNSGQVVTWLSNGDGTYDVVWFSTTVDTDLQNGEGLVAIDVNGDGSADLVHITTIPGAVVTWLSNSNGTYTPIWYTSNSDRCLIGCGSWRFGDVNHDNKTDLIHVTTNPGQVVSWLSSSNGTYNLVWFTTSADTALQNGEGLMAADVNGDGKTDLVHVTTNAGAVASWLSNGDGTFNVVWDTNTSDPDLVDGAKWLLGDVNGDRRTDLIHLGTATGTVLTWLSNGDGSYAVVKYISPWDVCIVECGPWVVGDVNHDAKADLIHVTTNPGQVIEWLGEGGTGSPPATPYDIDVLPTPTTIGMTWSSWSAVTYNVYRATASHQEGSQPFATGLTTPSFADTFATPTPYAAYYYESSAVNALGESARSYEFSSAILSDPRSVTAVPGDKAVTVSWQVIPGIAVYEVERSTAGGAAFHSNPTAVVVDKGTYKDTNLPDGVRFYYRVAACVGAICTSGASNEVSAVPIASTPAPPAPTGPNLVATQVTGSPIADACQSFSIGFYVCNYGQTDAPAHTDAFFMSYGDLAGGPEILSISTLVTKAGACYIDSVNVPGLEAGEYTISLEVDVTNAVAETNELDNTNQYIACVDGDCIDPGPGYCE